MAHCKYSVQCLKHGTLWARITSQSVHVCLLSFFLSLLLLGTQRKVCQGENSCSHMAGRNLKPNGLTQLSILPPYIIAHKGHIQTNVTTNLIHLSWRLFKPFVEFR